MKFRFQIGDIYGEKRSTNGKNIHNIKIPHRACALRSYNIRKS